MAVGGRVLVGAGVWVAVGGDVGVGRWVAVSVGGAAVRVAVAACRVAAGATSVARGRVARAVAVRTGSGAPAVGRSAAVARAGSSRTATCGADVLMAGARATSRLPRHVQSMHTVHNPTQPSRDRPRRVVGRGRCRPERDVFSMQAIHLHRAQSTRASSMPVLRHSVQQRQQMCPSASCAARLTLLCPPAGAFSAREEELQWRMHDAVAGCAIWSGVR